MKVCRPESPALEWVTGASPHNVSDVLFFAQFQC